MRAGSMVLSTNEVSTTRLDNGGIEVLPTVVPPLLLQAARPAVTATTHPDASHRCSCDRCGRIGPSPLSWRGRLGKRSHRSAPQVKRVTFQLRNDCVAVPARRGCANGPPRGRLGAMRGPREPGDRVWARPAPPDTPAPGRNPPPGPPRG